MFKMTDCKILGSITVRVNRRDEERDSQADSESETSRSLSCSLKREIMTEPHDHKTNRCEEGRQNSAVGQTYQTIRVYCPLCWGTPVFPGHTKHSESPAAHNQVISLSVVGLQVCGGHRSRYFALNVFSFASLS